MAESSSDLDQLKLQTIIVESILGGAIVILIGCVIYLFISNRKLTKLIRALDPVSGYKKVGPSLYVKHALKDTQSSLSSSFKHFGGSKSNPIEGAVEPGESTAQNRNVGTLDRNFFTRSDFSFDDSSSWGKGENPTLDKRQRLSNHDPEAMEAITNLDKVLY